MHRTWPQLVEAIGSRSLYAELLPFLLDLCRWCSDWPGPEDLNRLADQVQLPVRFVEQPAGERRRGGAASLRGYLHRVHVLRLVPVRPRNAHDLFNALTYFAFPRTKLRLAMLQAVEQETRNELPKAGGRGRTRAQDLLTMFDEGGLILQRGPWPLAVFGHAIHEHFLDRQQPVRGLTWLHGVTSEGNLDEALCNALPSADPLADPQLFAPETILYSSGSSSSRNSSL